MDGGAFKSPLLLEMVNSASSVGAGTFRCASHNVVSPLANTLSRQESDTGLIARMGIDSTDKPSAVKSRSEATSSRSEARKSIGNCASVNPSGMVIKDGARRYLLEDSTRAVAPPAGAACESATLHAPALPFVAQERAVLVPELRTVMIVSCPSVPTEAVTTANPLSVGVAVKGAVARALPAETVRLAGSCRFLLLDVSTTVISVGRAAIKLTVH